MFSSIIVNHTHYISLVLISQYFLNFTNWTTFSRILCFYKGLDQGGDSKFPRISITKNIIASFVNIKTISFQLNAKLSFMKRTGFSCCIGSRGCHSYPSTKCQRMLIIMHSWSWENLEKQEVLKGMCCDTWGSKPPVAVMGFFKPCHYFEIYFFIY